MSDVSYDHYRNIDPGIKAPCHGSFRPLIVAKDSLLNKSLIVALYSRAEVFDRV